ncbi:MAG: RfaE bifunctional protein, domain I [Gemmatimonadota bacterium]|nr:MAG: RfaE bifunctional protein, domain I [Gemmatimonadota bacterium]
MKPPLLSPEEFRDLSRHFPDRSVLVVGDLMLDEYVWGEAGRISPEAPVPVVDVQRESLRLGGAANVARNIVSLGGRVELLALVGQDDYADSLRNLLDEEGIGSTGLVADPDRPTTRKTRIVASRQQVVRVDRESRAPLKGALRQNFIDRMVAAMEGAGGLVVSDYGKGVVDRDLMEVIAAEARDRDLFVAVDPKESHFYQYRNISVVTPNVHEASRATRIEIRDDASLEQAGRKLLAELQSEAVLITRGPDGMSLFRPDQATTHIPVMAREVYDVTGAGDTVIATFTLARSAGATLEQAAVLSNAAAAVVVGEIGTAAVTPRELEMAIEVGYPMGNAT